MVLTDTRARILSFVEKYLSGNGYPPTIREIGAAVGLKSTRSVKDHLDRLVEDGYLARPGRSARAMTLGRREGGPGSVPIVGQVAAGRPILAQENITGSFRLPGLGSRGLFFLQIRGDSMTGDGILNGDYVLVRPQPFVEQGETAVVIVGDEATVKHFFRRGDAIELAPSNPAYQPMLYGPGDETVQVAGKVVGVLRLLEEGLLQKIT
jgi:repressor LexA